MAQFSLIVFSICLQAAIGMMVFTTLAGYLNKEGSFRTPVISAAVLAVIGLLASFLHLGQPLHAVNALAHFATSWLSREIWLTSLFTGLSIIAALLIWFKPASKGMIQVCTALATLFGIADVYAMASVYTSTSVSAWNHGAVPVEFYAATLSMGTMLFLVLSGTEAASLRKPAVLLTGLAVALQVVAMAGYYIQLGTSSSLAAEQSLALLSSMNGAIIVKWLFILFGAGLLLLTVQKPISIISSGQAAVATAAPGTLSAGIYMAAALFVVGQIVGRYLFFAMMIVSRVGLN